MYSPVLAENLRYALYLPPGYESGTARYPVLFVLHGRGEDLRAMSRVSRTLDALIDAGHLAPVIAVMPDAPWSRRAGWYVDSAYSGQWCPGRPAESALTGDLVGHVDATYRTVADRDHRGIAGVSMGGAGALRYVLHHQRLFARAVVLSPAVYVPRPPQDSSTRAYGAYGDGETLFAEAVYDRLNYPAGLAAFAAALPAQVFVAVGTDEPAETREQTAALHAALRETTGVGATMHTFDGGHDWDGWLPALATGLRAVGSS
jgi:enterochelin esterase-like enzyme